jgi:hypothetical protein
MAEIRCKCGAVCETKQGYARHLKFCPVTRLQRVPFGAVVKPPVLVPPRVTWYMCDEPGCGRDFDTPAGLGIHRAAHRR